MHKKDVKIAFFHVTFFKFDQLDPESVEKMMTFGALHLSQTCFKEVQNCPEHGFFA